MLWPLTKLSIYCKIPLLSCEMNIMISGAFACVFAEFHFDRKFEYYLLQTYFPSMLVVMLSWVSFWIDPAAVPARISLGLLTVLTMTTQTSVLNSRLPRFIHKIILFFFYSSPTANHCVYVNVTQTLSWYWNLSGAFACVYGEFRFSRKFEYYFLQIYIPSFLVVVLSWLSFWIDIEVVPARITLGLLTVLTATTQASAISARLPK